ncbi:unnamed protein product [Menidia menidia]|uniref:(Atlantic silverside) hypothetical protein n=1 Tax=Menidia menidia TaxID=238744 RepID=A0A8S4B4Z5_9TELE|nr:unnamed protein product [Menidia menidia]
MKKKKIRVIMNPVKRHIQTVEALGSSATLGFPPKTKGSKKPAKDRAVETHRANLGQPFQSRQFETPVQHINQCITNWACVGWSCESQTLEVRLGEDVTLTCSNISASSTLVDWFRVAKGTQPSCVSSMFDSHYEASLCDGFQSGKFNMSSNISTIFLQIKGVDFSDSGLYFCGVYKNGHTVLGSAIELIVKEKADGVEDLMSVILGALSVFLTVVVVVLAVRIRRLQTGWVSVSVSEFHTVEVQPGEEVTLLCSNLTKFITHIYWFKLADRLNASCISYMVSSDSNASLCAGYKHDQFKMTSNITKLFLNIKQVDFSDSGLYFCGFYRDGHSVFFSATHLQVQDACNGLTNQLIIILGGGTILIITVIICLVVIIRTFHTGWVSVSVSEFHTVEVQPGEEVTLLCSNFSRWVRHIFWFKMAIEPKASCISSMSYSDSNASLCDGYENGQFTMTSNTTNLFLNIKQVDFSDSGLYFCGYKKDGHPVIFSATHLQVQDACNGLTNQLIITLGGGIIFLVIAIICLVTSSDVLNYTAVNFCQESRGNRRSADDRELETHVVYAATRHSHQ